MKLSCKFAKITVVFIGSLFLGGCAGVHEAIPSSEIEIDRNYEYIIGPGDELDIFVWGYSELSISLPVRPYGKITTRLVEDMPASGKTPTQLARDIEVEYSRYVKRPVVSVTVSGFVGTSEQQIKIVGGGSKPRTIPYSNNMTLLDLMIAIGGLGEYANGNRSVLVRKIKGEEKSYNVRVHDLLKKGDISANVPLYPGDILIIPESWF